VFFGVIDNFPSAIKKNIHVGLYNTKVVPILTVDSYVIDDQYNKNKKNVVSNNVDSKGNTIGPFQEIVEGVFITEIDNSDPYSKNKELFYCLVTRQIGTSDPKRWKKYSRISVIYEKSGQVHIWSPLLEEILDSTDQICKLRDGYDVKWLQPLVEFDENRGLKVMEELYTHHNCELGLVKRNIFNDSIPVSVMKEVIRNFFISEENRFNYKHQKGKHLPLLAIYDYVDKGHSMEQIFKDTGMINIRNVHEFYKE
jgi:hypothetical protein